jgi:hypothetical protein
MLLRCNLEIGISESLDSASFLARALGMLRLMSLISLTEILGAHGARLCRASDCPRARGRAYSAGRPALDLIIVHPWLR